MADKDWADAWAKGDIGFHQRRTNDLLERFGTQVWGESPGRVLVPLCGKSLDMVHLAQSAEHVVGIEFVAQAVEAFFVEQGLTPSIEAEPLPRYEAGPYTLFAADFFAVTPDVVGTIDSVFDRASLVALDAATRQRYGRHLTSLLPVGAKMLLVTFDYDQAEMQGPPFAVPDQEVRQLFGEHFSIELLATNDVLNDAMSSRGLTSFVANAYALERRER